MTSLLSSERFYLPTPLQAVRLQGEDVLTPVERIDHFPVLVCKNENCLTIRQESEPGQGLFDLRKVLSEEV